jgi:hypothetical protein
MRNRLSFCLIAVALVAASPASAGLFGKKDKPAGPANNLTPTVETDTFRKATKADIEKALRADPLAQAAFFAAQFSRDPTNAEIGLHLSNAQRAKRSCCSPPTTSRS